MNHLHLEGTIMPHSWFLAEELKLNSGKPNLVAITLLADLCHWYKLLEVRDELTGEITYQQKFQSDKLQRSYEKWGATFGFTREQTVNAVKFLCDRNLITKELRTLNIDGRTIPNVMYFEPVPDMIAKISNMV